MKNLSRLLLAAIIGVATQAYAQTTFTFSTSSTSTAWLNAANWTGLSGKYPGLDANASSTADNAATDVAQFGSIAAASIGINMNTSANTGVTSNTGAAGSLSLGAISLLSTSNKNTTITNSSSVAAGTLTLNGATINSIANTILNNDSGNLLSIGGNNALAVALGNATNNIVQINGAGGITISREITGVGRNLTLTGTGSGILTFSGSTANTYSGTTSVNSGRLDLNKTAGVNAIAGDLVVGDGVGAAGSANTTLLASNQIANTSDVTVNSDGTFAIGANSDTVDVVILNGGSITGTTGVLTGSSYDFRSGSASANLGGSGVNMTKSTAGTVILTGSNTFSGTTTVDGGTLSGAAAAALGSTSGVTVNSTGTLLIDSTANVVNDSANLALAGGTLAYGSTITGANEVMNNLSLSGNTIIDFASSSAANIFTFNSLSSFTGTLSVYNWFGTYTTADTADNGSNVNKLLFNLDPGFTANTLIPNILFYSDAGTTFVGNGLQVTFGSQFEIVGATASVVPIPEPGTFAAALMLVSGLLWSKRRKFTTAWKMCAPQKN